MAVHNLIPAAIKAEKGGADGILLGCFYDPGLRELRELLQMPVVGVGEATLHTAATLCAGKFSVIVGRNKWIPKMADNARSYGLETRIASWRSLEMSVAQMDDRERAYEAIIREAKVAMEVDRTEVICLGCTGLTGLARRAQQELGIPVLDPVAIGLKVLEFRAELWRLQGVSHSKVGGYESPPIDEFAKIYASNKRGYRVAEGGSLAPIKQP
ncbi:aspartate/glutamate racemase family protein [Candidatus Reidiella endopervernicosa]|uniref:Aspartate/glutamate racemase family protein n=1 Tax=Candidatus Reidiella endopervernicosa TaxID=2738883 RepID=A0A6N0HXL9_9GAMM|nr:aspartate/glutamate racemase family protein [Candidatus Reidiella endopervernicosa]QKQ26926.1 aspartate/glutamate racemase family protein [Candidatus Reidiella endopervernicosa]